jgi:transposase InsO family protein
MLTHSRYIESFNSKLADEWLDGELLFQFDELTYVADHWRMDYNHFRPHSSLDYTASAAFAAITTHFSRHFTGITLVFSGPTPGVI